MAPYGMLSKIQTIFLTCLLVEPEDKNSFRNFKQRATRVFTEEERKSRREREKNRRLLHGDEMRKRAAERYAENPEPHKAASRAPAMRAQRAARLRQRRIDSPEEIRGKDRLYRKNRLERDPNFKMLVRLRSRQSKELRRCGGLKSSSTMPLSGCTVEELWVHLESLFKPGMTKENWGPVWHIDHIKPCVKFDLTDPEQQKACFHWTNLQPLFAEENLKKGGK